MRGADPSRRKAEIVGGNSIMVTPPHLALGCVSREFLSIVSAQTRLLNIDVVDMMIMTCVAVLSTQDALSDPSSIEDYDGGRTALPLKYCRGVHTKEISYDLNLSHETVRRRLENLCSRGFILKNGKAYLFPYQGGGDDYTKGARMMAVNCIERLANLRSKFL